MDRSSESQRPTTIGDKVSSSDIDIDLIMTGIRRDIRGRRGQWAYQSVHSPGFEDVTCPEAPDGDEYSPLLHFHLRQVNQPYTQFLFGLDLNPSWMDALPVVGHLWTTLRRYLHQVSLHYVNKLIRPMLPFNRHLAIALNLMTRQSQKQETEITRLKQRLDELESRLADVEEED